MSDSNQGDTENLNHENTGNSGMKPSKCNYCNATFLKQKYLNYHENRCIHVIKKCTFCGRVYRGKFAWRKLSNHQRSHNSLLAKCKFCDIVFSSKKSATEHARTKHEGGKIYTCRIISCQQKCTSEYYLKIHEKKHTPSETFEHCGFIFASKIAFKMHLKSHLKAENSSLKSKCSICAVVCSNKKSLSKHFKRMHSVGNIICKIESCQQKFHFNHELKKHEKRSHKKEKKLEKFQHCGLIFSSEKSLKKHLESHIKVETSDDSKAIVKTEINPLVKCRFCGKIYLNSAYAYLHERRVHQKVYICRVKSCRQKFRSNGRLIAHEKKHLNMTKAKKETKYKHCGVFFASKHAYERHIETHSKVEVLSKCRFCSVVFAGRRSALLHEKNAHTNGKVYECRIKSCQQKFPHFRALQRHEVRHIIGKFQHCGYIFASKSAFTKHMQSHIQVDETDYCNDSVELEPSTAAFGSQQIDNDSSFKIEPSESQQVDNNSIIKLEPSTNQQIRIDSIDMFEPSGNQQNNNDTIVKLELSRNQEINDSNAKLEPRESDKINKIVDNQEIKNNSEENTNNFECVCGLKFPKLSDLEQHNLETHSKIVKWSKKCLFCQAKFFDESGLTMHMKKHTGEKAFKCKFCGELFIKRNQWIVHEAVKCQFKKTLNICKPIDKATLTNANFLVKKETVKE